MAKGTINGGICGFITVVTATIGEDKKINLDISTECPNFKKVAKELVEIDPNVEIFKRLNLTETCTIASKYSPHPSCIVPSGILKTIEVEANFALPQEAGIKVEK